MRAAAVVTIVVCNLPVARADVTRCATGDATVSYSAQDLPEASADTGWFPSDSPAQLRITGTLVGETTVAMQLAPSACWGDAMTIAAAGVPGGGLLDSEYGAELQLFGQIHTSILGQSIDWEGQIPIPFIPSDLLMAGTTAFDPTLLPGAAQTSVAVTSNPTSPITVVSTDVIGDLIDIVGISGGLNLTVQGEITTRYQTTAIAIGDGSIEDASAAVTVASPAGGFDGALAVPISASGVVHYDPSLIFAVHFYVKILGISVVNFTLASVALPLPAIDREVTLAGAGAAFALPHLDPVPTGLGFASGTSQSLALHNAGGAPLTIAYASGPDGVQVTPVTIAPGEDGALAVTAASLDGLDGTTLVLATNDPDHPQLAIALDTGDDGTVGPQPVAHAGGCSTSGGGAGLWVVLAVLVRTRRAGARRRSRPGRAPS